jgi:hypothetical protein
MCGRTLRELIDLCVVGVAVFAVLGVGLEGGGVPFCGPDGAGGGRV